MKFQLFSDIHTEHNRGFPRIPPAAGADVLVLAGDIGVLDARRPNLRLFLEYCSAHWKHVVYVLGNHEFYLADQKLPMEQATQQYKELCAEFFNVHLLDNSAVQIGDVLFYGFTGWTPMRGWTTADAACLYNDYARICTEEGGALTTDYINALSLQQAQRFKRFMETHLNVVENPIVVVVTHFPPIRAGTSHPKYGSDDGDDDHYFAWHNLLQTLALPADKVQAIRAWISGHTHFSYDFVCAGDGVRYFSNQLGYPGEEDVEFSETGVFEV